jgi:hypothetical protein
MKTLRIAGLALIASTLIGCSDSAKSLSFPAAPAELKDCKFFYVTNSDGHRITVVRCPMSVTTTVAPQGKSRQTTVVIDGVEYVQKQ